MRQKEQLGAGAIIVLICLDPNEDGSFRNGDEKSQRHHRGSYWCSWQLDWRGEWKAKNVLRFLLERGEEYWLCWQKWDMTDWICRVYTEKLLLMAELTSGTQTERPRFLGGILESHLIYSPSHMSTWHSNQHWDIISKTPPEISLTAEELHGVCFTMILCQVPYVQVPSSLKGFL